MSYRFNGEFWKPFGIGWHAWGTLVVIEELQQKRCVWGHDYSAAQELKKLGLVAISDDDGSRCTAEITPVGRVVLGASQANSITAWQNISAGRHLDRIIAELTGWTTDFETPDDGPNTYCWKHPGGTVAEWVSDIDDPDQYPFPHYSTDKKAAAAEMGAALSVDPEPLSALEICQLWLANGRTK